MVVNDTTIQDIEAVLHALRSQEATLMEEYESHLAALRSRISAVQTTLEIFDCERVGVAWRTPDTQPLLPFSPPVLPRNGPSQAGSPRQEIERNHDAQPISVQAWARKLRGATQIEALMRIAHENGGIVRTAEAKRIFLEVGLAKGNPKWVGSHLYHLLGNSEQFTRVAPGAFRLVPTSIQAPEEDARGGDEAPTQALMVVSTG